MSWLVDVLSEAASFVVLFACVYVLVLLVNAGIRMFRRLPW